MAIYSANGYRAVQADGIDEAANVFGERAARKHYGRGGYVRTLRRDSWAQDGSTVTYEAFIGRNAEGGGTTGHNIWITVSHESKAKPQPAQPAFWVATATTRHFAWEGYGTTRAQAEAALLAAWREHIRQSGGPDAGTMTDADFTGEAFVREVKCGQGYRDSEPCGEART